METRRLKAETAPRFINWARVRIGLTGRLLVLVIFAVVPALVIQAWNEYDLRIAREADIRQQVVQTTKQFGEEIGELREGAALPIIVCLGRPTLMAGFFVRAR